MGKLNFKVLFIALVFIFLLLVPHIFTSSYYINLFSYMLIFGLLAMSLDLLTGYLGLGSLGHAAFFGSAAYFAGILNARYDWGFLAAFAAGVVFSIILSALFALLTTRITGVTFLMVNLALGQVMWGLAHRWNSMTGGDNGLIGITRPVIFGISFCSATYFYYLLFVVVLICFILLYLFVNSPFGLTLKGIKLSTKRMKALGYDTFKHRYVTFVIAGTFSGIAGVMFAFFNNFVSPIELHTITSAEAQIMVLLGGAGTLFGPLIGAAIVVILENLISAYTERWVLILGLIYVLTVMCSPGGLINLYQRSFNYLKNKALTKGSNRAEQTASD